MYIYLWCFIAGGFTGWLCEVAFAAVKQRKFVNRGFLNGPFCPIYGFGLVWMDFALGRFRGNMAVVLIGSMVVGSALELAAGFLLEKVFKQKWWDYSDEPHNFHGYICLNFSIVWGIAGGVIVRLVMPALKEMILLMPEKLGAGLLIVFGGLLLADFAVTVFSILGLNRRLKNIEIVSAKLREGSGKFGELFSSTVIDIKDWYESSELKEQYEGLSKRAKKEVDALKSRYQQSEFKVYAAELSERTRQELSFLRVSHTHMQLQSKHMDLSEKAREELIELRLKYERAFKKNKFVIRILKAFPDLKSMKYNEQLEEMRQMYHIFAKKSSEVFKKRNEEAVAAYESNVSKGQEKPFAHRFSYAKLFWVFMIGNVMGFVFETFWCFLIPPHQFELRVSVVFGPFILIYGFGAVLFTLCLHKLYAKLDVWIFLCSMLMGGAFEYICSFLQQAVFGTVSWEYSGSALNVHGRTNLMYSFFWGILGVLWIKDIYPRISRAIERVPKKTGQIATAAVTVFMAVNMALSAGAVLRWSERVNDVPAANPVQASFDKMFDDSYMETIYPHMQYVGKLDIQVAASESSAERTLR